MFRQYFGLKFNPFDKEIPTDKLFESRDMKELDSRFKYMLDTRGICLIVGESGSGKSIGLRRLYESLNRSLYRPCYLPLTTLTVRVSVTQQDKQNRLDFTVFPQCYREMVKKYFRTIITKRSLSHCTNVFYSVEMFFRVFYEMGYGDGFLEHLSRTDIERYLYELSNRFKDRNVTYYNKFISYPRTFLEYIQLACYKGAPKKEAASLIFEDDIPKRERDSDRLKRVRFIPEPVMKQLDANIMELDRPEYLPMYILLRETGWRGADILNLRYDSCLEKIWNAKEQRYISWLCGEITKTGIALLKISIRDSVSEMLEAAIHEAEAKSTPSNNPEKYLFVNYTGRRKGEALSKGGFVGTVKRLIQKKDIRCQSSN